MVRALAQQLRPLLAGVNSFASGQAAAKYAVPAVAVPSSGGLFGSKRVTTPLSEPLPNVIMPNAAAPKKPELQVRSEGHGMRFMSSTGRPAAAAQQGAGAAPGPHPRHAHSTRLLHPPPTTRAVLPAMAPWLLQVGTVGNIKAAALDVSGPSTCIALFVGGGSSAESPDTAGAAKLLEYMAFSATKDRCVRRVRRACGAVLCCGLPQLPVREHAPVAVVLNGQRVCVRACCAAAGQPSA
jgi:hypothetical protein